MTRVLTNATASNAVSPRELEHRQLARQAAAESIVLLKNEGALPLTPQPIALFGAGAATTIKGGTGSGEVNERYSVSIEQGLLAAGFEVTSPDWLREYEQLLTASRQAAYRRLAWRVLRSDPDTRINIMADSFQYPVGRLISAADLAAAPADTCIYVIARQAGECADRRLDGQGFGLAAAEIANLQLVAGYYRQTILIINASGALDLRPLDEIPGIRAVLFFCQQGMEGGNALADLLTGAATPSGCLTASWPWSYADWPGALEFSYLKGASREELYREDIYVGYRYFDSFGVAPRYPFGFGLSYSDFSIQFLSASWCAAEDNGLANAGSEAASPSESEGAAAEARPVAASTESEANSDLAMDATLNSKPTLPAATELTLRVRVTNTGALFAGKKCVQLYVSAPYGQLQHEYQSLATWAKTDLLLPDQSQELRLQLDFCQLAAYDESQACWRLEAGDYLLCLGENSRQTQTVAVVRLDQAVITEVCSNICPLTTALETIAPPARMQLTPQTQPTQLSWPKASQADPSATERLPQQLTIRAAAIPTVRHDYQPRNPQLSPAAQTVMNQLSPTEMIQVVVASGLMDNHPAFNVPGAAAYTTSALVDKGLPTAALCDGPAGLRLSRTLVLDRRGRLKPVEPAMELLGYLPGPLRRWLLGNPRAGEPRYQYASAFPVGTALAQTWNLALIEELGQAIGREMTGFGVSFLLAPGLNIQRNPLCGRNYEYFSEDPLLSGRMAAALTRGVQSWPGCYVTIKHFAANNQETDRQRSNSVVGERALREIYLKGFGLAVAAGAQAVMTSYNRVNGVYTANSWDLCSKVLRLEWGFNGLVMTDWLACAPDLAGHGAAIQAGNDLICPGGGGSRRALRQDLAAGRVSLAALRESCGRVVELVLRGRTAAAMRESLECENQD